MKISVNLIVIILTCILSNISSASPTGGLVWLLSNAHFKNVDKMGMVNLNERWAWIQTDKWRFPLYAVFSTAYKGESNILGKHWRIPLFESKAFPRDEKTYTVYMPEGRILNFYRSKKSENIYRCTDVWTGVFDKGLFIVKSIKDVPAVWPTVLAMALILDRAFPSNLLVTASYPEYEDKSTDVVSADKKIVSIAMASIPIVEKIANFSQNFRPEINYKPNVPKIFLNDSVIVNMVLSKKK